MAPPIGVQQPVNTQPAFLAQALPQLGVKPSLLPPQLPTDSKYSNQPTPNATLEGMGAFVSQNPGLVNILAQPAIVAVLERMGVAQSPEVLKLLVRAVMNFHANPSVVLQNPEAALKPIIQLLERAVAPQASQAPRAPANSKAAGPLAEHFNSLLVRDPNGKPTLESAREMARFVQSIPVAFHEGILPTVVRLLNQSSTPSGLRPSDLRQLNDALDNFQKLPQELRGKIVQQLEVDRKEAASQRNRNDGAQNLPTLKSLEKMVQPTIAPTAEFPAGAVPRQLANVVLREMAKILISVLPEAEVGQWLSEVSVLISASPRGGPIDLAQMVASMRAFVGRIVSLHEPQAAKAVERLLQAFVDRNPRMRLLVVTLLKGLVAKGVQGEPEAKQYLEILKSLARSYPQAEDTVSMMVRCEAIRVLLDLEQHRGRDRKGMEELIADINLVGTLNKLFASRSIADFMNGISILKKAWPYLNASVRNGYIDVALKRAARSAHGPLVSGVINLVLTHLKDVGGEQRQRLLEMDLHRATLTEARRMYEGPWNTYAGVVANDNARRQAA